MKKVIFFLFVIMFSLAIQAGHVLDSAPKQLVYSRWQKDFPFQHDKGVFFAASTGPQWVQSIQNPKAAALRFGGDLSLGWFAAENLALHVTAWGSFLEEASFVAAGPGVTGFFGDNFSLGAALGLAQVTSTSLSKDVVFNEWVLAGQLKAGKYWWLGENTSLGISLIAGLYGLSISSGKISTVGWQIGPRIEFIFN